MVATYKTKHSVSSGPSHNYGAECVSKFSMSFGVTFGWNFCYSCAALVSKLGKHCRKGCSTLQQLLQPMLKRLPAPQKDPYTSLQFTIHCSAAHPHSLQCSASTFTAVQRIHTKVTNITGSKGGHGDTAPLIIRQERVHAQHRFTEHAQQQPASSSNHH